MAVRVQSLPADTIDTIAGSFYRSLAARRRSPRTIQSYREAIEQFDVFLAERGMPRSIRSIRREHVESFITYLLDEKRDPRHGRVLKPATARNRYMGLRALFLWALDEEEIERSPMAKMRPPSVPPPSIPVISDDELRRLLKVCEGKGFRSRRDTAVIRLFLDSGMRRAELAALTVADLDMKDCVAIVRHGKGDRARLVSFGPAAAQALDRYLRERAKAIARWERRGRPTDRLWIGSGGAMTDSGIAQIVRDRSIQAGLKPLHAHQFRHTFAHRRLASGMNEGDVQILGGWRDRGMLSRYGASAAQERALAAARSKGGLFDG